MLELIIVYHYGPWPLDSYTSTCCSVTLCDPVWPWVTLCDPVFVVSDDKLIYLDPHFCQDFVDTQQRDFKIEVWLVKSHIYLFIMIPLQLYLKTNITK